VSKKLSFRLDFLPNPIKKILALSKGYRQRVGIAQALIHKPNVLILDEPTSGLDPNQIVEIRNLILSISKEKTIILTTHIMQEVEAICDRVIIINKGNIIKNEEKSKLVNQFSSKLSTIQVEFNAMPDISLLSRIPGITGLKNLNNNVFLIEASGGRDVREDVFNFAVQNNLKVLSMQKKEKSLQELFGEWTSLPPNSEPQNPNPQTP
jgi:ABC-2 type transport system ATP-binding protein